MNNSNKKLCFALIFIFLSIQSYPYGSAASVYIDPPSITTSSTGIITLNFRISNVINLRAYSIKFNFDNSIAPLTNATKGSFLTNGGINSTLFSTQPSIQIVTNTITIDEAILGAGFPVTGSGQLFSVQFNVQSAGTSIIEIESVILKDSDNQLIPVTFNPGQLIVLLSLNTKIFLQGPFSTGTMNTSLLNGGNIPLAQPYSSTPWNYSGAETLSNIPSGVVDWVLVELRTGISSSSIIARRAALLLNDGRIVDLDGLSNVHFVVTAGNYFVVIRHRNHLSIMTSSGIALNVSTIQYDFSTAQTKAYGNLPMISLSSGVYGMVCGDANADGLITGTDFNLFNPKFRQGVTGYEQTDWNLDGIISGTDFNIFNPNYRTGKTSQVPN